MDGYQGDHGHVAEQGSLIDNDINLQQSALPQHRQQGRTKPAQVGWGNKAEVSIG